MKRGTKITCWSQLKRGDFFSYDTDPDRIYTVNWDTCPERVSNVVFRGRGKKLQIPGLSDLYETVLDRKNGTLHVGCQTFDALAAFKALGKALGYEVEE